ncbi:hypothetical protein PCYB_142930 [Plasmodium cynomolgi strain B]|uniref:Rab-GAP TBC domain-containing protein n=1 Tax=Plasmodium cynomolgi (strain B) TaxID=1120755 RepID=K6V178_PLACD|nr:hypothetical protein PCYB_142930 [Plasmodium cynomolgi strain B]GAB68865.1 hypothetical protein PCYB_142930 [Plasmodium cynomolgi strain B]
MEYKLEILSYLLIFKKKNERIAKFDEQIKTCINIFEKVLIDEEELAYLQINKDTFRTRPELSFFNLNPQQTINNNVKILNSLISLEEFEEEPEEEIPSLVNINEMGEGPSEQTESQAKNAQDEKEKSINGVRIAQKDANEQVVPLVDETSPKFTIKSREDTQICQKKNNYEHSFGDHSADVCDIVNPKRHYDLLCRILFIYAKIHPYVKYVQGMNEILAPLYFIIFNDPLCNCPMQGEADTFFCFIELMQKQKDVFCEGLDNTDDGINGKLKKFSLLLRIKEYEIWKKLHTLKIETQYYALKWILLLLTQEFDMADTIILYDHFIINNDENFILYICLVICSKLKSSLLCGNFTVNLKLLQNIPPFDPYDIIYEAKSLMSQDFENRFNITEVYNQYYGQKKRINSLESLRNCSSIVEGDTSSYENLSTMDEGESGSRRGSLLKSLRNKSIVQNIKNYISNKMDMAKRADDHLDFDEL